VISRPQHLRHGQRAGFIVVRALALSDCEVIKAEGGRQLNNKTKKSPRLDAARDRYFRFFLGDFGVAVVVAVFLEISQSIKRAKS
jgi:hypothetical protein